MYLHVDGAVGDECGGGGSKEEKSQLGEGKFLRIKQATKHSNWFKRFPGRQ